MSRSVSPELPFGWALPHHSEPILSDLLKREISTCENGPRFLNRKRKRSPTPELIECFAKRTIPSAAAHPNIHAEDDPDLRLYKPLEEGGKVTSGSIDHAFSDSGIDLFNLLQDIFAHAWTSIINPTSDELAWLTRLHLWRERVGVVSLKLISAIHYKSGHEHSEQVLGRTIPLSRYAWWRICKMVADVEVIANHANKTTNIAEYFTLMANMFLELWIGFVPALMEDCCSETYCKGKDSEYLKYPIEVSYLLGYETFRIVQNPDVFPDISAHHAESDQTLRARGSKIHAELQSFFSKSFFCYEDFLKTAAVLYVDAAVQSAPRKFKKGGVMESFQSVGPAVHSGKEKSEECRVLQLPSPPLAEYDMV